MGSILMFYFGMVLFFTLKKHILLMLLTLEFMSLVMLMMLINFLTIYIYDTSIIIYFMIIMVCEAVMGLVLLTLMVRTHGSDYSKSSFMLMC
uniref:NADH-ubiquinone oxidoreductase chain 4L n=1 Tax=Bactericera cockerelli TaxID=290155 RepID=A0A166GKY1_9HEMI|nr:NADH dehydrogenase subunit 4L [Bactericera cockerelli]ANA07533.1 NADH dehydrogenase subunit 4L [Bactericera cockerelli]